MIKEMQVNKTDNVNHPSHYTFGTIETIDYITSVLGDKGTYNYCIGNALKYISRAEHKGKNKEDLEKAIWYINYAISRLEKKDEANN